MFADIFFSVWYFLFAIWMMLNMVHRGDGASWWYFVFNLVFIIVLICLCTTSIKIVLEELKYKKCCCADKKKAKFTKSNRGFKQGQKKTDLNGTTFHLCESSLADQPAIRLYIDETPDKFRSLHLSKEQAGELVDEIYYLFEKHYQNNGGK